MFELRILKQRDFDEIHMSGDRKLINPLHDFFVRLHLHTINYQEYINTDFDMIRTEDASFHIATFDLKKSINDCSVAQIILNFVLENKLEIDERTKYVIQYWAFEIKMIEEKKSYRSKLPKENQKLTSPKTINTILNECKKAKYLPSVTHLFNFLEHSKAMEGKTFYLEPLMPYKHEIQEFANNKNLAEIRKSSRIIAQGYRYSPCLFSKLDEDINIEIASLTGNPSVYNQESAKQIAINYFRKP